MIYQEEDECDEVVLSPVGRVLGHVAVRGCRTEVGLRRELQREEAPREEDGDDLPCERRAEVKELAEDVAELEGEVGVPDDDENLSDDCEEYQEDRWNHLLLIFDVKTQTF